MLTPEAFSLIVGGIRFVGDMPSLIHEPIRFTGEVGEAQPWGFLPRRTNRASGFLQGEVRGPCPRSALAAVASAPPQAKNRLGQDAGRRHGSPGCQAETEVAEEVVASMPANAPTG